MSQIIITEYESVGVLRGGSVSQSVTASIPGKILAHQELDGAEAGEASADFQPNTRFIKIHAIDEDTYFAFTDNPALVTTNNRDFLNEKESVYHGVFHENKQIYHNVSVVDPDDIS